MSRPGHRKSQSTSALATILSTPGDQRNYPLPALPPIPGTPNTPSRDKAPRQRRGQSTLPSVQETDVSSSASMSALPGLTGMMEERTRERRQREVAAGGRRGRGEGGVEDWLGDLRSLRSSSKRRMAALKALEGWLVEACLNGDDVQLEKLLEHQPYDALIALLSRHAQTLSQRSAHTSLPAGDELAMSLVPELSALVGMLQGICLISKACKNSVGEGWVMEMFIDVLLLLRSQPAAEDGQKQISYSIMELLFCVLVDSPKNARTFEKLSGLEAVVRVLKGSGVTKEVRMKCIEFLYFYLLPEQNDPQRAVSSSSSSSASSAESTILYPPSPLSTSRTFDKISITTTTASPSHAELGDIDMPFVPQTPRKRPQPNLGYLTPATRRVSTASTSLSSTPGLPTVPASPNLPSSPRVRSSAVRSSASSAGLAAMLDEVEGTGSGVAGGAELTPRGGRMSRGPSSEGEGSGAGKMLGLGLPKRASGMTRSSTVQRDLSTASSTATDPFSLTAGSERSHSGSSGSSTVVPGRGGMGMMSRSSTQPSLAGWQSTPSSRQSSVAGTAGREMASGSTVRRISPSPLAQSTLAEGSAQKPRPRSSMGAPTQVPRTPRTRHSHSASSTHSRTQSHLSGLPLPPPPPVPQFPAGLGVPGSAQRPSRSSSKPRGFPAELTKGLPPSASSPSLAGMAASREPRESREVLGAAKRVVSDKRLSIDIQSGGQGKDVMRKEPARKGKEVKSVEEKKEMLGMWLGNVEQLVQGVEKVSFWGSIGNARKGKK
ncbi:hypothetical protein IAT38_006999 [Cryptococcus sp. DSM 104549]